jgi:hypothetical protein
MSVALREKTGRVSAASLKAGDFKQEEREGAFVKIGWSPSNGFFVTASTGLQSVVDYFGSVRNARIAYAQRRKDLRSNINDFRARVIRLAGVREKPLG